MSTGTEIIQSALEEIRVHTAVQPAPPEAIEIGRKRLNAMIARWEDDRIRMGCVPLNNPGDELSEPLGARTAIELNLALDLKTKFPGAQVDPDLPANARRHYTTLRRHWQEIEIPKPVVRSTLPKGDGNYNGVYGSNTFFDEDETIGGQ